MAVGAGLAGSIGFGVEPVGTYGTYAPPTVWFEFESETLTDVRAKANASGLASGVLVERGARRTMVSEDVNGQIVLYATQKKIGILLAHVMSSDVVPTLVSGLAYTATHVDNNNGLRGKSFTIQKGVPQADGTVKPYSFLGCKITAMQIELGRGEMLKLTLTIDGRAVSEAQALVAPTYVTGLLPYSFKGWALTSGAYGSETALGGISKLTLTLTRTMKTDRYNANGGGLKDEPVQNGRTVIAGTFDAEFVDKTRLADVYANDSAISLISSYVGASIGVPNASLTVNLPAVYLNGSTPGLAGEDIVSTSIPFVALYDDVRPAMAVTYVSTDTTL